MTLKDWVTLYAAGVATYAALLSTYSAVLVSYLAWFDRRPRLRLAARIQFLIVAGGESPEDPILGCTIANIGRVPITLDAFAFRKPGEGRWWWRRPSVDYWCPTSVLEPIRFPHDLAPGKRCTIGIWAKEIAKTLETGGKQQVVLIPVCTDQTARTHHGPARVFTLADLTEPDGPAHKTVRRWWPWGR